jgi:hypothetical protein
MGLLHPGAILALAAAGPALVLAYLARERPTRAIVSSVLAFRALRGPRAEAFRGRPRFNWMFFVELLILALAVLAIAAPYTIAPDNPIAVVLDNSAAMRADVSAGQTRFEAARDELIGALAAEPDPGQISVYVTAPQPHRVAEAFDTAAAARSALGRVEPCDAPDDLQALARTLGELASGAHFRRVIFAGDHPLDAPLPPRLRAITVGEPIANYAIGSFVLRRESFGAATMRARLTLANFSSSPQRFEVAVSGDGRPLDHAQAHLDPGEVGSMEFPALATAQIYRAELTPSDDFPLDNVAYATAGAIKPVAILFVSPTPGDAAGLSPLPGVTLRSRSPEEFLPADLAGADLAIFEYAIPKELPPVNTLLVMPPPGDPVFNFAAAPSDNVLITGWRTPDPLTDAVNFRLIQPRRGEYFGGHPWMAPVVSGSLGGLVIAGERASHRYVATGVNPFPYLGKKNLPMSVLTLNMLSYLAGLSTDAAGFRTGEPWPAPAGVTAIVPPSGRAIAVQPGALFTDTAEQGVYQLIGPGEFRSLRAVNLADLAASDLGNTPALKVAAYAAPEAADSSPFTRRVPLEGSILVAIMILAAAEAAFAYRRRRPLVQPQ